MNIRGLFVAIAIVLVAAALPASACELELSLDCSGGRCVAETRNVAGSCGGFIYTALFSEAETVRFSNASTSGFQAECFSSDDFTEGEKKTSFLSHSASAKGPSALERRSR
jgi:hypothetical protein